MGGEHRVSRDPRLREESSWRRARIPASLRRLHHQHLGDELHNGVAGIDVGEDLLDVAWIPRGARSIEHRRIPLAGLNAKPLAELASRMADAVPGIDPSWLVRVDSPRMPRDVRRDGAGFVMRTAPRERDLDLRLRRVAASFGIRLSMFPTPVLGYFQDKCAMPTCKPHLRALHDSLFGELSTEASRGGGLFTRFMIAGFACYRAMELLGIDAFESYPDLDFRIAAEGTPLIPKRSRNLAMRQRIEISRRLRLRLGLGGSPPHTMDQADAEILALTAVLACREGMLLVLADDAEGRFMTVAPPLFGAKPMSGDWRRAV